ncbi:MAG: hypothetical protein F6K37_14135 [Moorea sp. SIO4E2]|uniref:hypothetical protein n=1 Tax=Moorena sp. SIO4E2 TaxID=2607826 RepID=UPI0013BAF201|nr:hypothetical protein [Moorena sp. SIO4E2]NEQ07034.1 hypothetical protein [Moorena sp. SIO4E2]
MTISATTLNHKLRLNHLIDAIDKQLDPVLFAPESLAAVRSLATKLAPVNYQLFELRLSDSDPSIDLSVPLTDELLSDRLDWCSTSPWHEISTLKQACQINGEFGGAIATQVFWGEFDREHMLSTVPIPGIFFDVSQELIQPQNQLEFARVVCRAWEILLGKALPESTQNGIKTALAELPDGVGCTHFGIMLSRLLDGTTLPDSLRLHPARWQIGNIANWLKAVGAGAVASDVEQVTQEIPHLLQRPIVTVDAATAIGPRVGIECYSSSLETVFPYSNKTTWLEEFTDWLVKRSLASPAKVRGLLDWDFKRKFSIELPQKLGVPFNYYACHLNLSHLKLVFEPRIGLQAKAYLLTNFIEQEQADLKSKSPVLESFDHIW